MKLTKKPSSANAPERIFCQDKRDNELATVFCDGEVRFNLSTLSLYELNEVKVIAENFKLFYLNLP